MLRESQKPDSAFLFIGASSQMIFVYRRDDKGAFDSTNVDIPKEAAISIIVKFAQTEGGKSMEASLFDSKQWFPFPKLTIPVNAKTLVGFAQSSGNNEKVVKAQFIDVSPSKEK